MREGLVACPHTVRLLLSSGSRENHNAFGQDLGGSVVKPHLRGLSGAGQGHQGVVSELLPTTLLPATPTFHVSS